MQHVLPKARDVKAEWKSLQQTHCGQSNVQVSSLQQWASTSLPMTGLDIQQ